MDVTSLDDLAAALQVTAQAAQATMESHQATLFHALPAELSALIPPTALRVGLLTLDIPVLVEEVEDPSTPGNTVLALRVGGDTPASAQKCTLTLSYEAGPPAIIHAAVDDHPMIITEPTTLHKPQTTELLGDPGKEEP